MRLPRRALDAYNAAIKQCGDGAERASLRALSVWLEANPDAEISEVREFCKTLLHTVGTSYGQDAGDAAYALRSLVADGLDIELPDVDYAYEPDPEYVDKTARYQVEKLKAGDSDGFGKAISDAARYFAERGANDTMTNLGEHDAKKLGKRVLFARVPTGATTCPYCLMLASRGFVYSSELKALNANHRNCDCRIVEGFPGMTVEGYDPDLYYDMWKHPEKYENAKDESVEPDDKPSDKSERESRFNDYLAAREKRSEIYNRLRQEKDSERKQQIRAELSKADEAIKAARDKLTNGEFMLLSARIYPVGEYITPSKWNKTPSTDEIVQLMGGGDKTTGSCSSLAFAYFANKGGEVVRDFRGGSSCNFFSQNGHIKDIAKIDGVESFVEEHKNAFTAAGKVVQNIQDGKRYYLCVGKHAAVVEKRDDSIYYLELQSQTDNGWHKLTNTSLKQRFGCTKSSSISGIKLEQDAILIDGDTLSNNAEFLELMGYINTPEGKQKKGVGGGVK